MLLIMSMQNNWHIKQVDFSNTFVQAKLDKEVYITMPPMFTDDAMDPKELCLKLKRSLYGMVDAPRYWYLHLKEGLHKLGFQQSENDPGIYFGRGMVLILYVDDLLVCGPDKEQIEQVFVDLEAEGYKLTCENNKNDAFNFLGIELNMEGDKIKFTQQGLIKKLLETTEMTDCNGYIMLAVPMPLRTNADGKHFTEK